MRLSPNFRAALIGAVIGLFGVWIASFFILSEPYKPKVVEDLQNSYAATCRIDSSSTGVLLDTGYILASGHGVDDNGDLKVQPNEREVIMEFYHRGDIRIVKGRVITMGNDYSIIQPAENIRSNISVSLNTLQVGQSVYTFGHPMGKNIHLAKGYHSQKSTTLSSCERVTLDAYLGNSGGGIFAKDKVYGVMNRIASDRLYSTFRAVIVIPEEDGLRMIPFGGTFEYRYYLPGWSEYFSTRSIYRHVAKKGLGFTLINPVPERDMGVYKIVLRCFVQVCVFLVFISWFRKELFR